VGASRRQAEEEKENHASQVLLAVEEGSHAGTSGTATARLVREGASRASETAAGERQPRGGSQSTRQLGPGLAGIDSRNAERAAQRAREEARVRSGNYKAQREWENAAGSSRAQSASAERRGRAVYSPRPPPGAGPAGGEGGTAAAAGERRRPATARAAGGSGGGGSLPAAAAATVGGVGRGASAGWRAPRMHTLAGSTPGVVEEGGTRLLYIGREVEGQESKGFHEGGSRGATPLPPSNSISANSARPNSKVILKTTR